MFHHHSRILSTLPTTHLRLVASAGFVASAGVMAWAGLALVAAGSIALGGGPARASAVESGGPVLSLADTVARALENNFDARIAALESGRASDKHAEARAAFMPKVNITSYAGYSNRLDATFQALDSNGDPATYGLANVGSQDGWLNVLVDQVVLDLSRWRAVEGEQLAARIARVKESEGREFVAFEVVRLFAKLVRAQRLVDLDGERESDAKWLDGQAMLLFEAGRVLSSQRDTVALHLENARLDSLMRRGEAADARRALWLAMGATPEHGRFQIAAGSVPALSTLADPEHYDQLVAGAPELEILRLQRDIEAKRLSAARAIRLPTLKMYGGYIHYGVKRFDNYHDEFLVGVDLKIPVFDGFEAKNAIRGADKTAQIAQLRFRSILEAKRSRVGELTHQLQRSEQRLELIERRIGTAAEEQRLADLNLRVGRGSLGQALSTREQRARFQQQAIDVRYQRVELWASLQRELGTLGKTVVGDVAPPPAASAVP
ncbi:MAG: TolC family protein [Deltaproteobacteria bacterium]|nr:TolC family protein [Deltaproteobacteria bacterium]MBW2416906.1 TolC family protein [Deltaproteobacteria bacterium]